MATIRASWKRVVRLREFESETLELAVETGWDELNDGDPVKGASHLNRVLADAGDALVAARAEARAESTGPPRVPSEPSEPSEPDEFL